MLALTRLIGLSLFLFVLAGAVLAQENPAGIYPQQPVPAAPLGPVPAAAPLVTERY